VEKKKRVRVTQDPALRAAIAIELKAARVASGLSRDELAQAASVTRAFIRFLEIGDQQPNVGTFIRLARALSLDPPIFLSQILARTAEVEAKAKGTGEVSDDLQQ
jgi:transcriptional regulator with XRE-family HTH domain